MENNISTAVNVKPGIGVSSPRQTHKDTIK